MNEPKLLEDASEQDVIAAAIVLQNISSGPDFVGVGTPEDQAERLNRTITEMRAQPAGTGWVCAAQVSARGVVSALQLLRSLDQINCVTCQEIETGGILSGAHCVKHPQQTVQQEATNARIEKAVKTVRNALDAHATPHYRKMHRDSTPDIRELVHQDIAQWYEALDLLSRAHDQRRVSESEALAGAYYEDKGYVSIDQIKAFVRDWYNYECGKTDSDVDRGINRVLVRLCEQFGIDASDIVNA